MLRSLSQRVKKTPKQNKALAILKNKVFLQAVIAVQTLIVAVALIFGMSAAWYTNVAQTSGLHISAASWGFSGQITVEQSAVEAAPGDTGTIAMTIDNVGNQMSNVTVYVNKYAMAEEMKQRLFFYVDIVTSCNGEVVDRVYVNATNGYTYTVLENHKLVMTDDRANDARLHWQWVYDMLGYYFVGTVSPETVDVEEYLRPVEYDLDRATFSEDGLLTMVGNETAEEFLYQLSQTDGYSGSIVPSAYANYYQVSVDENGYGIWVYLCDREDIRDATIYDTQLGKNAAQGIQESYRAMVTMVGQEMDVTYREVFTPEEFAEAMEDGGMIQLGSDLTLPETLLISSGNKTILDLNGNTITGPASGAAVKVQNGADLVVLNGNWEGQNKNADVFWVDGSSLTLKDVNISGQARDALYVVDKVGKANSCVRMFNCTMNTSRCSVYVCGNGPTEDGKTRVIIEDCDLKSEYFTVSGNGNTTSWGTDIQIFNSKLEGYYTALYQPQGNSVTTIIDSVMKGMTGIALKGGDLIIRDSQILGTGTEAQIQPPSTAVSGFADTGDALYVEDGYGLPISVKISGDSEKTILHSANGEAVRVYRTNSPYVDVEITGGWFSHDVTQFLQNPYIWVDYKVVREDA